jgi:hypothetical protein
MEDGEREPPAWDTAWVRSLLVQIRRQGVPAHEARLTDNGVVSISFEPGLAQAEILEGILRSWPGVATVERIGERVLQIRSTALPRGRTR